MYNALGPASMIPYREGVKKPEKIRKAAVVIPIAPAGKGKTPKRKPPVAPAFKDWNLPEQEDGYIKAGRFDFL